MDTSKKEEQIGKYLDIMVPKDKFIVGYAGTLGKANAMEFVIQAMNNVPKNICLCLLGSGNEKENLIEMANSDNIVFLDKVPKSQVLPFLKACDLLYLGWKMWICNPRRKQ